MSTINFDFDMVYGCEAKVRAIAGSMGEEATKLQNIISTVQYSWVGAGADKYITYLQTLYNNVRDRSQRLYEIADALNGSAAAAEEADRLAAQQLAEAAAQQQYCVTEGTPSASQQSQQNVMAAAPSQTTNSSGNSGAARNAHTSTGSSALGTGHSAISSVINNKRK